MTAKLRSWWQQIKQHPVATVLIVLFVALSVLVIFGGYKFNWDWTGFNHPSKTLWDWLQLLGVLAVPVVVGFGAVWFTTRQGKVNDAENKDNQRENALQTYIDKMSELLLKEHLGERTADGKLKPEYEHVRNVARLRTITVLTQLDVRRVGYVFAFLNEAKLMSAISNDNVVSLSSADLRAVNWSLVNLSLVNLSGANLSGANLSKANLLIANLSNADLSNADLSSALVFFDANLSGANLSGANLSNADFSRANLLGADFSNANLSYSNLLGANLSGADLSNADFSNANLSYSNLSNADLQGVIDGVIKCSLGHENPEGSPFCDECGELLNSRVTVLRGARFVNANLKNAIGVTVEELEEQAKSLKGAIMPDGSKHN